MGIKQNQNKVFKNVLFIKIIIFSLIQVSNAQNTSGPSEHLKYSAWYKEEKSFVLKGFSLKESKCVIESKIKFPEIDGKRVEFEDLICISGKIYLFTSLYNKKDKINNAYVNEISLDGILNPKCIQIDKILNATKDNTGYFAFKLSSDSINILAYHAHDENIRGEMIGKIFYKSLNSNLETTSTNEIEMPRSFDYCSAIRWQLIGNQNLVYLEKNYTKVEGEKDIIIKYNACLYNANEKKLYKTAIMPNEKYILDISIVIANNQQLLFSGIYGIDKSFGGSWDGIRCLKGSFYYLFDQNNLSLISQNSKNIQEALSNSKLFRYHLTSSKINNDKIEVTCQVQQKMLVSGVGHDNVYEDTFGQFISTSFNLKDKLDIDLKIIEK